MNGNGILENIPYHDLEMVDDNIVLYQTDIPFTNNLKKYVMLYNNNQIPNILPGPLSCLGNVTLNNVDNTGNSNNIFVNYLSDTAKKLVLAGVEKLIYIHDAKNRYVYFYTGTGYSQINNYLSYKHFGLDTSSIVFRNLNIHDKITFSDGDSRSILYFEHFDTDNEKNHLSNEISSVIRTCREDPMYDNLLENLRDEFFVFRLQCFMCVNSPGGNLFNPSVIKPGSMLFVPQYLSASYTTNYNYNSFVNDNIVLLRIKLKKQSKRWVVLNKYSMFPSENEVLLDKASYYLANNVSQTCIKIKKKLRNIMMLDVTMLD